MTASGEVLYGGRRRPAHPLIARIRAVLNPSFRKHFEITWASIAASTAWTQARLFFGTPDVERFQMEPGLTADLWNLLENAMEEWWERYLKEGKQETPDLGFSTASWAGVDSNPPSLLSGQSEVRHLTEAESVPPGFTRLDQRTIQEEEATSQYRTPMEAEQQQTLDEELGAHNVMNIGEDWYSEIASAVKNILDQPMEVDQEERSYQVFDASDILGPDQGPGSPITARDDHLLDLPSGLSRAPGEGRPPTRSPAGSSGSKITGCSEEGKFVPGWRPEEREKSEVKIGIPYQAIKYSKFK